MHQKAYYSLTSRQGMTLIELLFSLTLTLFIVASVSSIYLLSMKNHYVEQSLQTIQQNTRITFQLLNSAIHSAGNIGCAQLTDDFPISFPEGYNITKENRILPYHGNEIKPESDAFTVRYANPISATLVETMNTDDTLHINAPFTLTEGDVMLISDCKTADILIIQHVSNHSDGTQIITANANLSKKYAKNSELSAYTIDSFYIAKTDRKDYFGSSIYALYKKDQFSHKTELVEGINEMKIDYAVRVNNQIIEKTTDEINSNDLIIGISMKFNFVSLNYFSLEKIAYTDVSLL